MPALHFFPTEILPILASLSYIFIKFFAVAGLQLHLEQNPASTCILVFLAFAAQWRSALSVTSFGLQQFDFWGKVTKRIDDKD